MPFALTAYSLPHIMGYLPTKAGQPNPSPLSIDGFLDTAVELGLEGAEFPLSPRVPSFDSKVAEVELDVERVVAMLHERNLRFVADYGTVLSHPAEHLIAYLHTAQKSGAKVCRATISGILCGDRRKLEGGWPNHLETTAARLREVLPHAEELGICIALENHQDATTQDLLRLMELCHHSPSIGITLDTGNPLAVGEEPVEAARLLAPFIRHVHIKDYTIHFAPEGYRLVRCPAGTGVIDFPAILEIVGNNGHNVLPGIEVAAQATRTIPLLEPDWWECHAPMSAKGLASALAILWSKGRPMDEPYSTAWENGENSEAVVNDEWRVLRESAAYFKSLHQGGVQ